MISSTAALSGLSHTTIATHLSLSEGTICNLLSAAIQKLGERNQMEAARLKDGYDWQVLHAHFNKALSLFPSNNVIRHHTSSFAQITSAIPAAC
nr:LuxR C-terminal-related transcriptional regulator [Dictyobacter formicarum]